MCWDLATPVGEVGELAGDSFARESLFAGFFLDGFKDAGTDFLASFEELVGFVLGLIDQMIGLVAHQIILTLCSGNDHACNRAQAQSVIIDEFLYR